jgi:hypothetical protein
MKVEEFRKELARLLDRNEDVRACAGRIADTWKYDLASRKSGTAYKDEDGKYTTSLDLAAYLSALADRRAVITLPEYKGRRASTHKEGEVVVSKENRHGRVMRLTSNQEVWSFNVMVEDANVITTGSVGEPRNFMLQDIDGTWHDGWKTINLLPATPEEKKLFENSSAVSFDYLVHPNRWTSVYSRAYLLAKVSITRLADQQKFLRAERKRIDEALAIPAKEWPKSEKVGEDTAIEVWAANFVVDGVEFTGDYTPYPTTMEGLEDAGMLLNRIDQLITQLRFHTRASEYAFWKHAVLERLADSEVLPYLAGDLPRAMPTPPWAAAATWTTGFKEKPKARTFWARLERDGGLTLRWRAWRKTERVAA